MYKAGLAEATGATERRQQWADVFVDRSNHTNNRNNSNNSNSGGGDGGGGGGGDCERWGGGGNRGKGGGDSGCGGGRGGDGNGGGSYACSRGGPAWERGAYAAVAGGRGGAGKEHHEEDEGALLKWSKGLDFDRRVQTTKNIKRKTATPPTCASRAVFMLFYVSDYCVC